nr:hypothetical protein [Tanacetum cinerariifolium]
MLKKITDDKGPVPIQFEWDDKRTLMPLGDHASHWFNYLGELIREMPLCYLSWRQVLTERKAAIVTKIGIGMPRLPSRMIPGTKPEPLKIAKTEQRARSYASRDPDHLLAFEIKCDGKFSQMLNQDESSPEFGNASGSGRCEDDEMVEDEEGGEDEEDEEDDDS